MSIEIIRANSTESKPFGDAVLEEVARSNVNKSKKMIKHSHPTAPLSSFNHRLALQLRNRNKPKTVLDNVLKIVAEIKEQNLRLDQTTYNAILSAYSRNKDQASIKKTLKEMKENGLSPSADSYNIALEVRLILYVDPHS
jgi:pentatricopeptide repeat protein